jgi:hypothetical protein
MNNKYRQDKTTDKTENKQPKINNCIIDYDCYENDNSFNTENNELEDWRVIKKHIKGIYLEH